MIKVINDLYMYKYPDLSKLLTTTVGNVTVKKTPLETHNKEGLKHEGEIKTFGCNTQRGGWKICAYLSSIYSVQERK